MFSQVNCKHTYEQTLNVHTAYAWLIINQVIVIFDCFTWMYMHIYTCSYRFRNIARSATEGDYQRNVERLKDSQVWKDKLKLQSWFERIWLANYKVLIQIHYYH